MQLQTDVPLAPLTTFRMGPRARYLVEVRSLEDLREAFGFIREQGLPYFVLGGGSNTIFTQPELYDGVVLKVGILGFEVDGTRIRIGAGENWDDIVAHAVQLGLSGIEAMSAIPGSAGATPIQNVGAYGTEISDTLESVDVYIPSKDEVISIPKGECAFSYRDSRFKHESDFVITCITLNLSTSAPVVPDYPGVRDYLHERGVTSPSLTDIREAIITIRKTKLPDPRDVASVGSFFKNPFVGKDVVERLRAEFENPVIFEQPDGQYKVGAGWLIDILGLKGSRFGSLGLHPNNALVITNHGGATYTELSELVKDIGDQVERRFGIQLELEPVTI